MATLNIEFKAKAGNLNELEKKLLTLDPVYIGEDNQVDTYFNVASGRLKLREGNIENSLIFYERKNIAGVKQSDILLFQHSPDESLKDILEKVNGIKVVVDKKRKIYFIDNVKFHFDIVEGLGNFVEVEAIDKNESIGIDKLKEQCNFYASFLEIAVADYIALSYSDMILNKKRK